MQHFDEAAQARIGGKLGDQRFSLGELAGDLFGFVGRRQKQQAIAPEEFTTPRLRDALERILVGGQLFEQQGRRLAGEFRRRRVDNRQNRLEMLREGLFERNFSLTPRQLLRNQRIDISINGKIPLRVDGCGDGDEHRDGDHRPRVADAPFDQRDDNSSKHAFVFSRKIAIFGGPGFARRVNLGRWRALTNWLARAASTKERAGRLLAE